MLPVPSRPAMNPPTSALPPLPSSKTRKSLPGPTTTPSKVAPVSQLPSKLCTPSISPHPTALPTPQHSNSTPNVPTLRSTSSVGKSSQGSPERTVRRTISIASFPQPPKVNGRSSGSTTPSSIAVPGKKRASDTSSIKSKRPSRLSNGTTSSYRGSQTPSLLNGSGDGKSIPTGAGVRDSEGRFSIPSPPLSRNSSAQGSYSTTATTFEDTDDGGRRGREDADDTPADSKRSSRTKEGKGNVIVSVRVRPDAAGNENNRAEGEWMVDGRRSLVAYRGREGGDYYYGMTELSLDQTSTRILTFLVCR